MAEEIGMMTDQSDTSIMMKGKGKGKEKEKKV
jgi:hypothetical protein